MVTRPDKRIKDFIRRVNKKFNLEKAILFGSRARGDYFVNSDYDVILVSRDFEGIFFTKRMVAVYTFWKYYPLEIEPICYTPKEFAQKEKEIGIVHTAVKEGTKLI